MCRRRYPVCAFYFYRRCFGISKQDHQINQAIRDREIRLIDSDGTQVGVVSLQTALDTAAKRELDLVKIAPQAIPPVCRIMDYGKYRFDQNKREKEAKKRQHIVELKEIRLSPNIDTADFNVKLRNAQRFLQEGNKVKVSVRFRGREMAHTSIGEQLLRRFAQGTEEFGTLERDPKLDGRFMMIFLASKTKPATT